MGFPFLHMKAKSRVALTLISAVVGTVVAGATIEKAIGGFPRTLQISQDIFRTTDSQHLTEVEPASYAFGSTIVSVFQVGRFVNGGGATAMGFATSTNGGSRWRYGYLPGITTGFKPKGPYDRGSDPAVAYDGKHKVWLIETLPILAGGGSRPAMVISRSTDGLVWQNPPVPIGPNIGDSDKTWITCDNWPHSRFYGHCYAEWDALSSGDTINMVTSTDGGKTWGAPKNSGDSITGQGGVAQVQPNGTVVVPFYHFANASMAAFRSTDGGASWTTTSTIAPVVAHKPAGGMRALILPGSGVDGSGKVYLVWMDCSFRSGCASNDIVMSSSADGVTWSAPVQIPIDKTTSSIDHFIPGFTVDPGTKGATAHLALTYYYFSNTNCFANGCALNVGFIASHDGGTTWTKPILVAGPMHLSWLPATSLGPMVGDYVATSIANGKAYGIFAVAEPPFVSTFDEAMFTITGGVTYDERGVNRTQFGMRPVNFRSDYPRGMQPAPTE
jgi:hypothetical protein